MKPAAIDSRAPSRREFIQRLAEGVFVFVTVGEWVAAQEGPSILPQPSSGPRQVPTDFNAFIRIGEDGRVTGFTGKIEMGQGVNTSLCQMLADELEVSYDAVDLVMGDTDLCPWDMGTFGSMTTRAFGPALRAAAAEAKALLLQLAAQALKLDPTRLVAKDGVIFDRQDPLRRLSYGALTRGRKIERHLKIRPSLKEAAQFTIIGQSRLRRDGQEKVTGAAHYAGDLRVAGMLYAQVLRPPAHGAKLMDADLSGAREIDGTILVQQPDLIAVLHENPELAMLALSKINARYSSVPSTLDDRSIFAHLLGMAPAGVIVAQGGDLTAGRRNAKRNFEQTYLNSYVAHAPIETHTALAKIDGDRITVWASTQNPFGARDEIARAIGSAPGDVRVIAPFLGGGFGGKTLNTQAVQAAQLAKAVGRPVQVMWTREDEFFNDPFRPAAMIKIASGIDGVGRIAFWDYDVYYAGERGAQQFYALPNHRTAVHGTDWRGPPGAHPFATGAWRGPGSHANAFGRESQMDLMAAAAGADPVAFRLAHLEDARMVRTLRTAADRYGWNQRQSSLGRGHGVACAIDAGTYVTAMAEVTVNAQTGAVRVERVLCAQDMGIVINPEGATIQIEGCITMGLGYALTEEIHFSSGSIADTNFDSYAIPRFSWLPRIETVLVENNLTPPQGGGEPAITVMGAVIANAIYDATGARLLQMPMTPERVRASAH